MAVAGAGGGGAGPGAAAGLLSGLGSLGMSLGLSHYFDAQTIQAPGHARGFAMPRFLQFLALGGVPQEITRKEARKLSPLEKVRVGGRHGKNRRFFVAPTQDQMQAAAASFEADAYAAEKQSFERLKDSPFFDSLVADSTPGAVQEQLGGVMTLLGQRALGAAAAGGLNLADPLVQAKALGPTALQGLLAQKSLQRQAGLTGLGLVRGPGSTFGLSQIPGPEQFQQNYFNTAAMQMGAQQYNAGSRQLAGAQKAALYAGGADGFFGGLTDFMKAF